MIETNVLTIEQLNQMLKKAYQDGYKQAVKDMEHFEETGVVIL
jgi:hypothetical protein